MKGKVLQFLKEEEGTETVEWAIMIGLIAVGAIAIIAGIGSWVSTKFANLSSNLAAS